MKEMHGILRKNPEIWDLFTRKEEYNSSLRDKNNRFPYYTSKNRNIFEPLASEFLMKNGYHVEYPDGKPFAVCLTHDIDNVYQSVITKSIRAWKNVIHGDFNESFNSILQTRTKKNPYVNFEEIMKLEEDYNARSSFYFLALDPGDMDCNYQVEDLAYEISTIQDWGWEVGLHVGPQGYDDLNKIQKEKRKLEKVTNNSIVGCRTHLLKFIVPDTWELLSQAGLKYDCSFGYADCTGFRNGMCHPFKPYNLKNGNITDIIEIPLIIMDDSLFDKYMRLDADKAWEITQRLIDTVAGYHGVITLVWHNTYLIGDNKKFYEKILKYCAEKNAWMTSGKDVVTWVNKN